MNSLGQKSERIARLQAAVRGIADIDWAVILPQLDAYIEAQLAGEDYLTRFPEIAVLLDSSAELAAAYGHLYEVETLGGAPATTEVPRPDLSFLTPAPTLAQQLRVALQRTGNTLRLQLSAALLPLLTPPPRLAAAVRSSDSSRYATRFLVLDSAENRPFTLTAYHDTQSETVCLVEVQIVLPGKGWPELAGNKITLTTTEKTQTEPTDAWGIAAFPDIPIPDLETLILTIELAE